MQLLAGSMETVTNGSASGPAKMFKTSEGADVESHFRDAAGMVVETGVGQVELEGGDHKCISSAVM
jgi:hypothetical protein